MLFKVKVTNLKSRIEFTGNGKGFAKFYSKKQYIHFKMEFSFVCATFLKFLKFSLNRKTKGKSKFVIVRSFEKKA